MGQLSGDRDAIALALTDAGIGITGFAKRPMSPKPGDAWPLLSRLEREEAHTFEVEWLIQVALPPRESDASDFLDEHWDDLFTAISPVAFVDRAEPVNLGTDTAPLYGLQITVRAE